MSLRYWRFRLRLAGLVHRSGCATCGCSKSSHVGAWTHERTAYCVYGGRHRDLDCRRYVAAQPVLGL